MSALDPLLRGIHAALITDPALRKEVAGRVYDRVPDEAIFPYLTYGAATSRPLDAGGVELHELRVHAWSRERGRSELRRVLDALRNALTFQAVEVTDHALPALDCVSLELVDEPGEVEHGIAVVRAVTEPLEEATP